MDSILKRHYLYLDLGFYSACNLSCSYCRDCIVKDDKSFTFHHLEEQIEAFLSSFRAAVVKLSGYGEITMWTDFEKSLAYLRNKFPMVQVISNGTFSQRVLDMLLKYDNVSPNLTIDGHTLEMNRLRVKGNYKLHEKILNNLRELTKAGRRVEVNCVLHKYNIEALASFCDYLSQFPRNSVMLFPFPAKTFALAPGGVNDITGNKERLVDEIEGIWEKYRTILPPKIYLDEFKSFLKHGKMHMKCHVHWANLGSGSKNERLHCPNYGEELTYGSMLEGLTTRLEDIYNQEIEHLKKGYVGPECAICYNHFHILNNYLEGELTLEELLTLPSLQGAECSAIAKVVKREFQALKFK